MSCLALMQPPRERNGTVEPQLLAQGQPRRTRLDRPLLALSAKGMTTGEIADTLEELDGTEMSHGWVATVTEAVWDTG
jgi:putative transposase